MPIQEEMWKGRMSLHSPPATLDGNGSAGISGFLFMTIQLENKMGSYPNLVIKKKPEIPAEPCPPTILHGRSSINSNTATDVSEFQPANPATNSMSNPSTESSCHSFLLNRSSRVLLRVLPVRVKGPAGEFDVLALCDEGATVTLMDGALARQLRLEGDKKPLCLQFINHGGQFNFMEVDFSTAGVEMGSRSHRVQRAWTKDGLQLPAQAVNIEELQQQFPHLRGLPLKDVGED
jgi:hypothetical protein